MQLHDPDAFELKQALQAFDKGDSMLSEICRDLGIRPGPVYDEYVTKLREGRRVPSSYRVRMDIEQHAGFDRVYNDLPIIISVVSKAYPDVFLYELADYEPLPDTEWVILFVPMLGFIKLYTSLFYDLGCYVEIVFTESGLREAAVKLAGQISSELNDFYRKRVEKETSLSHG